MKKYLVFLFSILLNVCIAQRVAVVVADNDMSNVSEQQLMRSVNALALKSDYPVILEISLTEEQYETINGIDTREVFNSNLSVNVLDVITDKTLGSFDHQIVGSAKNKRNLGRGISQAIRKKKKQLQKNITESLENVSALSCDEITSQMKNFANIGEEKSALYLIQYAPKDCANALAMKEELYVAYQKANCQKHITKANALIAVDNYTSAAREIINVDPVSPCADELTPIIEQLDAKVDLDKNRLFSAYLEYAKSEQRLESEYRSKLIDILIFN